MVEYYDGIEKESGVITKKIADKRFLYFVPDNGKYVFCSNDESLQQWCQNVKNKRVKKDDIKYVVPAALKAIKIGERPALQTVVSNKKVSSGKKIDPNSISGWDSDISQAFNLYCQKAGIKPPKCEVTEILQKSGQQSITMAMTMEDGQVFSGKGFNKQLAKKDAIKRYAQEVLGIEFADEKEQTMQKTKSDDIESIANWLVDFPDDCMGALNRVVRTNKSTGQIKTKEGPWILNCEPLILLFL